MQNPNWNVCMDVWEAHSTGGVLEVQVWDDDMLRRDDHIGTEQIDIGKTLLAPDPGRRRGQPREPTAAVPPDMDTAGLETPDALPVGEVISREVLLELRSARHKRGLPVVHLRLTWVPAGVPPPWGGARQGRPLQPWRHTDLCALRAVLETSADSTSQLTDTRSSVGFAGAFPLLRVLCGPRCAARAVALGERGCLCTGVRGGVASDPCGGCLRGACGRVSH